ARGLEAVAAFASVYSVPVGVYRVPDPLPRAYVVGEGMALADDEALVALVQPGFDPRRQVLLAPGATPVSASAGFAGTARTGARGSHGGGVAAAASAAGYAVLVESYLPAWRATLDGAPAEVLRANLAFRAVQVPAGRHRVEWWYSPRVPLAGALISAAAVA